MNVKKTNLRVLKSRVMKRLNRKVLESVGRVFRYRTAEIRTEERTDESAGAGVRGAGLQLEGQAELSAGRRRGYLNVAAVVTGRKAGLQEQQEAELQGEI